MNNTVKCEICGLEVFAKDACVIQPEDLDHYYVCKNCWINCCNNEETDYNTDVRQPPVCNS